VSSEKTASSVPVAGKRPRGRPRLAAADLAAAHDAARERICEAALSLFDRGGIDAISMREVARELRVSPMMPYKYFRSKDHLLQELRTRAFQHFERALAAAAAGHTSSRAAMEALFFAYLAFGRDEPRAYRLMFDYWVYDNPSALLEEFGEDARRQAGAWHAVLRVVEDYFTEAGITLDPLVSAHLIWAALHGLVSLEAARKLVLGKSFDELSHPMVRAILDGLPMIRPGGGG